MRKTLCQVITLYQRFVSPWLPPHCRYSPTCSQYMFDAIHSHGACRGVYLGVKRLGRCNPLGSHGYDPVPEKTPASIPNSLTKEASSVSCVETTSSVHSDHRGSLNG